MKILYISSDFNRSGAALAMIELAENMQKLKNDVILLYPGKGEAVKEAVKRGLSCRIIRSYEWVKPLNKKESVSEKVKWTLKHLYNIISIIRICHLIRAEQVDIVHNNTLWGYVGCCAAKITKTILVWHMRELLEQQQGIKIRWAKFGKLLINSSDALIAISNVVKEYYSQKFDQYKIHLIYDGVDRDRMYKKEHLLFKNDTIELMIAGGIRKNKRQADVIDAVQILNDQGFKIHLSIVGDDSTQYAKNLKERVNKMGLGRLIVFTGETSDIASFWEKSDIAITASEYEAFGRVTAEAMLAGCVVIASDSGANQEIVNNKETGYIYMVGDAQDLANTIKIIVQNTDKATAIAKKGQAFIFREFDSRKNAKQVLEIYMRLSNSYHTNKR